MAPHFVAIAACRSAADAGPDDLYPDLDGPALVAALASLGVRSTFVAWDDPRQDWSRFGCVVVRSTWDSVDRPDEYLHWARLVSSASVLVNPVAVIATTLDKRYLRALAARGVAVPRTLFLVPASEADWEPPAPDFVVKPAISAGGRETARYLADEHGAAQRHVQRLHASGQAVLVQEHVPEVAGRGEIKLVFIDGDLSHAIRTDPLLRLGAGVLERPWEVSTNPAAVEPTGAEAAFAADTLRHVEALCGARTTYARVDVVSRRTGEVVLMEVELIDPSLSLWADAGAAGRLAAAVRDRLP